MFDGPAEWKARSFFRTFGNVSVASYDCRLGKNMTSPETCNDRLLETASLPMRARLRTREENHDWSFRVGGLTFPKYCIHMYGGMFVNKMTRSASSRLLRSRSSIPQD